MRNWKIGLISLFLFFAAAVEPVEAASVIDEQGAVVIATAQEAEMLVSDDEQFQWICSYDNGSKIMINNRDAVITEEMVADTLANYMQRYDFLTSQGEIVNVGGGTLAIQPKVDTLVETAQLNALLRRGESVEGRRPVQKDEVLGDTYAEISLADQRMYVYRDGELYFDSPVTTGDIATGHATPRGAYYVYFMDQNRWLKGNYPGTYYVECWMRFTQDGYGLHDASWRSAEEFGGENYISNGSHGCINIPTEQAHMLFNLCYNGFPIVIY